MKLFPSNFSFSPHSLLLSIALLTFVAGIFLVAQTDIDTNGDGIPDIFEPFFGIEGVEADPVADPDGDGLNNAAEKLLWTDPLNIDTDFDGFSDGLDADPLSRAMYLWGDPRFTYEDVNAYPRPAWAGPGLASRGSPVEYPGIGSAWAMESGDCLLMPISGHALSNGFRFAAAAYVEGELTVSILDSNLVEVAPSVLLVPAGNDWFTNAAPFQGLSNAHVLSLGVTHGAAHVFASMLYQDTDGDGFDDAQNAQLLGGGGTELANLQPSPLAGTFGNPPTNAGLVQALGPWHIGFEQVEGYPVGCVNGIQGWTASNGVEVISGHAYEGSQSLVLRGSLVKEQMTSAERTLPSPSTSEIIWFSMRTKLVPGATREHPTACSAAFAIEGERIIAYDGTLKKWVASERTFPGIADVWARVDIRFDFGARKYTLCCQGIAICRDFGFADPSISSLKGIFAQNGEKGDAALDALVVSDREPDGLDFDGDGVTNAQERLATTNPWSMDTDGDGIPDGVELAGLIASGGLQASTNAPTHYAPFSWSLGFEQLEGYTVGAIHGIRGWTASSGVEVLSGSAYEGSQSLMLKNDTIAAGGQTVAERLLPSSLSSDIVWVSMRTKLVPGGTGEKPTHCSVAFGLEGERIIAYDGTRNAWIDTQCDFPGITSVWARVDIRFDFGARKYTLCCQGIVVCRDFGFVDPTISSLKGIIAQNGTAGNASLDALVVSDREPDGIDFDGDGVANAQERLSNTNPWSMDTDSDGMPDGLEKAHGFDPLNATDANQDADNDGLTNVRECERGTDPHNAASLNRTLYVDSAVGNNGYDGFSSAVQSSVRGPKAGVQQMINAAISGDVIELRGTPAFLDRTLTTGGKEIMLVPVGTVRF